MYLLFYMVFSNVNIYHVKRQFKNFLSLMNLKDDIRKETWKLSEIKELFFYLTYVDFHVLSLFFNILKSGLMIYLCSGSILYNLFIQGYPQRIRLQRRLYRLYTVYFLILRILCTCKLFFFVATLINRHNLWALGRLYSLIFVGNPIYSALIFLRLKL